LHSQIPDIEGELDREACVLVAEVVAWDNLKEHIHCGPACAGVPQGIINDSTLPASGVPA
jgi:hypothetical protein